MMEGQQQGGVGVGACGGNEITFMFQFGLLRDAVTVQQQSLNLKTIKELASEFVDSKVSHPSFICLLNQLTYVICFVRYRIMV